MEEGLSCLLMLAFLSLASLELGTAQPQLVLCLFSCHQHLCSQENSLGKCFLNKMFQFIVRSNIHTAMRAYMTSVNLLLLSFLFIVSVISVFYGRGHIGISRKNDEQDNTQETMDLFREKGRNLDSSIHPIYLFWCGGGGGIMKWSEPTVCTSRSN